MSPSSRAFLLVVALAAQGLAGCKDNISCVFTTGCRGGSGSGGLGAENPAILPQNGQWIVDGRPSIESVSPDVQNAPGTTAIVVVFSESMNPGTLNGAIEVVRVVGGFPMGAVAGLAQQLIGDGRVLVLLTPATQPLEEGDYRIRLTSNAAPTDVTGQLLSDAAGSPIGDFTVVATPPDDPAVVAVYPRDAADTQSDTSEIVVVFDRPVVAGSVNGASFDVKVGSPPADPPNDPPATPLTLSSGGATTTDTRVYTWRSVDAAGIPVSLGASADVSLRLSPTGSKITDADGDELEETTSEFGVHPFTAPLSASLMSRSTDAIGLADLTPGGAELLVPVDLLDGQPGDLIDLFLFGTSKDENPRLIALGSRFVTLTEAAPVTLANFTLADVDLTTSSDPTSTRLEDGTVAFAFRLRRGADVSTVRVLDVLPNTPEIDDPLLDTVAPTIEELTAPGMGTTDAFHSDQRNVVVTGRASEPLRSVEVTAGAGNNGMRPPVVGASEDGTFVAAPVDVTDGIVSGGTVDYTIVAYDAALNESAPVSGTMRQLGVVGPGPYAPATSITFEVFDAVTLAPLEGACVILHGDVGDGTFDFVQAGITLEDGTIPLVSAGAGYVGSVVTVDLAGYDLFTFHGIPSARLSIPLVPIGFGATSGTFGNVTSSDSLAVAILPNLAAKLEDTRRPLGAPRTFATAACSGGAGQLNCPFGLQPIRPGRLGAQSFLAGRFMQTTEASFSATQLLQAFCLEVPLAPTAGTESQNTGFELPFTLIDPLVDPTEIPFELPAITLDATLTGGIGPPVGDPATHGDPRITVESIVPGIPGSLAVGLGLAYDQGGGVYNVRSAQVGAASPAGFYGVDPPGTVDTDVFLRCELRDADGNVAVGRPRVSALPDLVVANTVFPAIVSKLEQPAPGGNTGGSSFNLFVTNSIPDVVGQNGLYLLELTDSAGRRWRNWRCDPPGTADVGLHFPDLTLCGGSELADGTLTLEVFSFSWPTLDPTAFLWTDVEREHDLFSRAETVRLTQP